MSIPTLFPQGALVRTAPIDRQDRPSTQSDRRRAQPRDGDVAGFDDSGGPAPLGRMVSSYEPNRKTFEGEVAESKEKRQTIHTQRSQMVVGDEFPDRPPVVRRTIRATKPLAARRRSGETGVASDVSSRCGQPLTKWSPGVRSGTRRGIARLVRTRYVRVLERTTLKGGKYLMKTPNLNAIALAAGLSVVCCSAQAEPHDDRASAVAPDSRAATTRSETDFRGDDARKPALLADADRPAMPIPIPGVGFSQPPERGDNKGSSARRRYA